MALPSTPDPATPDPATSAGRHIEDVLRQLRGLWNSLDDLDLATVAPHELAATLVTLQRLVDRGTATLARFVIAADQARVWVGSGSKNITVWLAQQSNAGTSRAAELTRLAEVMDHNTLLADTVRSGRMSTATAATLAPLLMAPPAGTTAHDVDQLVEACTNSTPTAAKVVAEHWRALHDTRDETELARARFESRGLRFSTPHDGMITVSGQLPTFEASRVRKCLSAFGGGRPHDGDTRTTEQRLADGLLALTDEGAVGNVCVHDREFDALRVTDDVARPDPPEPNAPSNPRSRQPEPRRPPRTGRQTATLLVTVPLTSLTATGTRAGIDEYNCPIPASVLRELAPRVQQCGIVHDGNVVLAVGTSTRLDLGRTSRHGTGPQYRALVARDGRCRWPGCTIPAAWCDIDHLRPWELGGTTDLDNLWLLCSAHHSEKHRAGTTCTGTTNGSVTIELPNGLTITSRPDGPITVAGPGGCSTPSRPSSAPR
ncbi:MAG: hypothetical protein RI958_714 [Actinomycetota bacterium]